MKYSITILFFLLFGCKNLTPEDKSLENCKEFVTEKWGNDPNFIIKNSDVSDLNEIKFDSENLTEDSKFHVSIIFQIKKHKDNMIFCFCDAEGEIVGSEEYLGVNED